MTSEKEIREAANQFGLKVITQVQTLGDGLIHSTYKVGTDDTSIILQNINYSIFKEPEKLTANYEVLYEFLTTKNYKIPRILPCITGGWLWRDGNKSIWRAQEYIADSYVALSVNAEKAYQAANCFADFSNSLSGLSESSIQNTLPDFHNVSLRYTNLEIAIQNSSADRLESATPLIQTIRNYKRLVNFYTSLSKDSSFKKRVMHHDCKLSNVLFNKTNHEVICPIDFDTTMFGYYFSDIGDIIRSMTPSLDENSTDWQGLYIRKDIYKAVLDGYSNGVKNLFSTQEISSLHHAGLFLFFMQAVRFLEDYLSNDRYYRITYAVQNLNRAKNQLILLEQLSILLKEKYNYNF